jgi:chromate transporter
MASSLTSFGGGQAFIGVADAVFVQTGFIGADTYYEQIIAVSSALPGPILMSIAAGIGFSYAYLAGGLLNAWLFGLLGIALTVCATAIGALILHTCFTTFSESVRLKRIVRFVMPIVCGLLLSIFITLLRQAAGVLHNGGVPGWVSYALMAGLFLIMLLARMKFRIKDIFLLAAGGAGTLTVLALVFRL